MREPTQGCMIWLILLLGILGPANKRVQGQTNTLRFNHITADDGLSNNAVYAVIQDAEGYMWFGTENGLNRYDGQQIRIYKHEPDNPRSLDNNWVTFLYLDSTGALWVCTSGGGLNRYDFETDSFDRFLNVEGDAKIDVTVVWRIFEDPRGTIWISTNLGIFTLDRETGAVEKFDFRTEIEGGDENQEVRYAFVDSASNLWIGTSANGLIAFDGQTQDRTLYQSDPIAAYSLSHNYVSHVLEDHRGTLWISTRGGLNKYNPQIDGFDKFYHNPYDAGSLSGSEIMCLFEDSRNDLWICTYDGGLNRLDREKGGFVSFKNDPAKSESLSNDKVHALYEDHSGILWIATERGINYVDLNAGYFDHIKHDPTSEKTLSDNSVRSVYTDPLDSNTLWVGTEVGGLNRINLTTGEAEHFLPEAGNPNALNHAYVSSLLIDRAGNVWAGTRRGINRFDRTRGTFTHVMNNLPNPLDMRIRVLYEAPSEPGILWVASGGGGLVRYDPQRGKIDRYRHKAGDEYSISGGWVASIFEDSKERLWVGTSGGGLSLFDRATETFTRYQFDASNPESLAGKEVNAIAETTNGNLWLATENGLVRFKVDQEKFYTFSERNSELPSSDVQALRTDQHGRLWLSTLAGISRFDPQSETFENFDVELGLQGRAFSPRVSHKDDEGFLYFGGPNGLNRFNPDQIRGNPVPPKLTFVDFSLFDERVTPGDDSPLKKHITRAEKISLKHYQNDLSFDYAALHYSSPDKNRYMVKLENYDRDWRAISNQGKVTYTSVNPGAYTFKVKASNGSGVWTEGFKAIDVIVARPWWQRAWAFGIYTIMLVGLLFAADRYQRARLLKKERAAASLREAELRAEAAELKSQASESQARALVAENERKEVELQKAAQLKEAYDALQDSMHQLRQTQRQLVHAEKLASLGELTAGIAHEIKNPLNFVVNFAALSKNMIAELKDVLWSSSVEIEKEAHEDVEDILVMLVENAERINQHGLRADAIVRNMMDHARSASSEKIKIELAKLLNQSIDLAFRGFYAKDADSDETNDRIQATAKELDTINIIRDFDESLGHVVMMPQDFTRVIINILDNAFYALQEKLEAAGPGEFEPRVVVAAERKSDHISITITDNGTGMDEATREKVFEPFFTTKPTGAGNTGLGLSLSYDIITEAHQGSIEVDSVNGEQTSFRISMPIEVMPNEVQPDKS